MLGLYQILINGSRIQYSTAGGTALSGFGANTDTYNPPSSSVGTVYYYCVLTIPGVCTTITSNTAKVTVAAIPTLLKDIEAVTTVCVGGSIPNALTMTHTGGAGNVTYDWYVSATPTYTGTPVAANGHSVSYTPPSNLTVGSHYYYVVISFAGSGCTPITSGIAEVVVPDPTPAPQTVC